jgi:TolB protein
MVAFNSDRNNARELYLLEIRSGTVTRLTNGLVVQGQPSWSSDGSRILFSARTSGLEDVYVINRDGSGLTRLTRGIDGLR